MIDWMESSTFRHIHEAGECSGLCKVLIRHGTPRFGPPSATLVALLEESEDPALLHTLVDRLMDAESWDDVIEVIWKETEVEGTVHGSMVELDEKKALPKGARVRLSVATLAGSESAGAQNEQVEGAAADEVPDHAEQHEGHRRGRKKR